MTFESVGGVLALATYIHLVAKPLAELAVSACSKSNGGIDNSCVLVALPVISCLGLILGYCAVDVGMKAGRALGPAL